jgi:hypothetical protein
MVLAFAIGGCERAGDRAAEKIAEKAIADGGRESAVEIDRERGTITVNLKAATRPKRWPEDVPFYPNARRARADKPAGDLQRLTLRSGDRMAEVTTFYRERLANDGWRVDWTQGTLRARKAGRELVAHFHESSPVRGVRAVFEVRAISG